MKYLQTFENRLGRKVEYSFCKKGEWPQLGSIFKWISTGSESIVEVIGTFHLNQGDFNSNVGAKITVKQIFKKTPFKNEWEHEDWKFTLPRKFIGGENDTQVLTDEEKEIVDMFKNAETFGI